MSHQVEIIISVVTPLFIAWPLATTRPNQVGLWLPPSHCSAPRLPNGHHGVFHMGFALGCGLCHLHKGLVSLGSRKPRKIDGVSGRIWISLFSNWKWKKHTENYPRKRSQTVGGRKSTEIQAAERTRALLLQNPSVRTHCFTGLAMHFPRAREAWQMPQACSVVICLLICNRSLPIW